MRGAAARLLSRLHDHLRQRAYQRGARHVCPRHDGFNVTRHDRWHYGRWPAVDAAFRRAYTLIGHRAMARLTATWPAGEYLVPRTCSWCDSAHPDDVLALILHGWRLSPGGLSAPYALLEPPPGLEPPSPPVFVAAAHLGDIDQPYIDSLLNTFGTT